MPDQLLPVGSRPRCLNCGRELRPQFKRELIPWNLYAGKDDGQQIKRQWRKEHPAQFTGNYGDYQDNRFCGLNCGYGWAVDHASPAPRPQPKPLKAG